MTIAEPNRIDSDAGDSQDAECLLYLLGELDPESSKRFEQRLADDPGLSDSLLQHANLITAVAQSRVIERPSIQDVASPSTHTDDWQRWRWVAAVVSVAACIALIFQVARFVAQPEATASKQVGSPFETAAVFDESVLIAKAWASSQHSLNSEGSDSQSGVSETDSFVDPNADESYDLVLDEQPSDIDSTLSWMFVAISSGSDAPSEEGNDG